MAKREYIEIHGAKAHNLKGANVSIPRGEFVVVTGLSGSGKSSLAFDTLYAEGQRRYMDTLSTYAKHFMGVLEKPEVEDIQGLSPIIAIEQKTTGNNPAPPSAPSPKSTTSCACSSPAPPGPTPPPPARKWSATPTSKSST